MCTGHCAKAPNVTVNSSLYTNVDVKKLEDILGKHIKYVKTWI